MGSMAIDSGAIVGCSHFSHVGATNCLARFFSWQGQAEVRDMGCITGWGSCCLRDRPHYAVDQAMEMQREVITRLAHCEAMRSLKNECQQSSSLLDTGLSKQLL